MKADLEKMARFISLIEGNPRIRVARLQEEAGLSRRSVYRYIQVASTLLPIRLENGVVIKENPPK